MVRTCDLSIRHDSARLSASWDQHWSGCSRIMLPASRNIAPAHANQPEDSGFFNLLAGSFVSSFLHMPLGKATTMLTRHSCCIASIVRLVLLKRSLATVISDPDENICEFLPDSPRKTIESLIIATVWAQTKSTFRQRSSGQYHHMENHRAEHVYNLSMPPLLRPIPQQPHGRVPRSERPLRNQSPQFGESTWRRRQWITRLKRKEKST